MYRLGVEAILGLRRKGDRLFIEPCIPAAWRKYEVTYRAHDTTYRIEVQNPSGVEQGVKDVILDGETMPGRSIPVLQDGQEHRVIVRMGQDEPFDPPGPTTLHVPVTGTTGSAPPTS